MMCTSIVSGIDAGPSPRTCCDGFGFKNLYGCYHPPVLTLIDRSFLGTLHHGWIRHGIAEIAKMAVVKDEELFNLLEQYSSSLVWTKFGTEMDDFNGDAETFREVCDLIIGKALEGYVKFDELCKRFYIAIYGFCFALFFVLFRCSLFFLSIFFLSVCRL